MTELFRAVCTCGWMLKRLSDESNLPPASNRDIVESVAGAHKFNHSWNDEIAIVGVLKE